MANCNLLLQLAKFKCYRLLVLLHSGRFRAKLQSGRNHLPPGLYLKASVEWVKKAAGERRSPAAFCLFPVSLHYFGKGRCIHRLRDMSIHTARQTALDVLGESIGAHGKDRDPLGIGTAQLPD